MVKSYLYRFLYQKYNNKNHKKIIQNPQKFSQIFFTTIKKIASQFSIRTIRVWGLEDYKQLLYYYLYILREYKKQIMLVISAPVLHLYGEAEASVYAHRKRKPLLNFFLNSFIPNLKHQLEPELTGMCYDEGKDIFQSFLPENSTSIYKENQGG